MPPCSNFRREQLLQEERGLRTQITVAQTQLVVVYSRLNDLAPSVALPAEVLVLIFRMLSPSGGPFPYYNVHIFETPALRKLVLGNNVTLDGTNATIIKDLTHLDIGNTDMPRLYKTIDVFQALLSMKSLALNTRASSAAVSFTIIILPSLTSIMLDGTASDCSKLLQHVRAPSVKACTLVCTSRNKEKLPVLLAAVSALFAQNKEISAFLQRPHQLFINMEELSSRKMTVRMAETEYSGGIEAFCQPNNVTWNPNWHMALSYRTSKYGSITLNDIASVCKVLCLDGVTDATL
ncbi:hypothetical protein AZE42_05144 [Rhizopogon vesiculosus]|uniref:Uncharacterized protein n=1 Tax=Rhizopogon vesiculosus TaxID=180088 RepID=A0A1J8QEX3_9AGAM|nr:hypothetical protein AZE42_05144 [Rhizopogon vesiculosus]